MATVVSSPAETVADLLARLGDIPPHRVRMKPSPGTATEQDVLDAWNRDRRLCELIDGTLVEKTVGQIESYLAVRLIYLIVHYLEQNNIGYCLGSDGMLRIAPHMVRIPDVLFISWERLGARLITDTPIPDLYPNLAIEVISPGNSKKEMKRNLREYFASGVSLVWYVYTKTRAAVAYTSPRDFAKIEADGLLDGGDVLPGFRLVLADLFARVAPRE